MEASNKWRYGTVVAVLIVMLKSVDVRGNASWLFVPLPLLHHRMSIPSLDYTLGSLEVGILISSFLYGVTTVQVALILFV